jgi:hypothetical protein
MDDARKLGERNWRNAARNRDSWQKLLRKALAQKGAAVPMMMMKIKFCQRRLFTIVYQLEAAIVIARPRRQET